MKARINNDCVNYIYEAFGYNHKEYEIGGIVLGLRTDKEIIAAKAVSISSTKDCSYSYSLDGDKATSIVNSSEYDFVGIWHSHINSCDYFSMADEMVNEELARTFGGIISVLVVSNSDGFTKVLAYLFDEDGMREKCLEFPSYIIENYNVQNNVED